MAEKTGRRVRTSRTDILLYMILTLGGLIEFFPFYNCVIISLLKPVAYSHSTFVLIPKLKDITLSSYHMVITSEAFLSGYKNTILLVVIGTVYCIVLQTAMAYALSRRDFPGRNFFMNLIILTMFFGGGLIPSYMLIRNLGLMNHLAAIFLPGAANAFSIIIIKNYFQSLPKELEESARIDGANDILILFKIIIPLSMPVIATFSLFIAVALWNEWFGPMMYIKEMSKMPIQYILRKIIVNYQIISTNQTLNPELYKNLYSEGIKTASIILIIVPIMCFYPFLQKYFVKGIMIGAIKS